MVDTIIITKGITAWINNQWKKVTGVVFGSGTDEIVALNVVQRDSDGEIVNPGEVEIEFPTGEDALLKDKTLKDIIFDEALKVKTVNGANFIFDDNGNLKVVVDGFEVTAETINLNIDGVEGLLDEIKGNTGKVFKHQFTQADLDVNGKLTVPVGDRPVSWCEVVNMNNEHGLTLTIGGRTVYVMKRDVDTKGIPLPAGFSDNFAEFTEIEVTGTDLNFYINVDGPEPPEE